MFTTRPINYSNYKNKPNKLDESNKLNKPDESNKKEEIKIPKELFDLIREELKKENNLDKNQITIKKMKSILRKLKLNKYYECIPYMIANIKGRPIPINREMEKELIGRVVQIKKLYFLPTNFSSKNYAYIFHKLCQLLEYDDVLQYFPLLKNQEKLLYLDKIWSKICEDCDWKFYPSV